MEIGNTYKVEADTYNIILSQKQKKKKDTNNQSWKVVGYFGDFRELLKFMVDNEIRGTGLSDLQSVADRQHDLHEIIMSISDKMRIPPVVKT